MKLAKLILLCIALTPALGPAQTLPRHLVPLLEQQITPPGVAIAQLQRYLVRKTPPLPPVSNRAAWAARSEELRQRVLTEIVYRGWPREWVEAPLHVEDLGTIPSGPGYRIRKLRYEIVPGFYATALLYEPATMRGKMPAILNVNGHGQPGKALEYKQKRCINQALRGILALNLEWIYFGDLRTDENAHWFGAHLDVTGANAVGLFYLAMRKGLDYLYEHPNVDRGRIGMTGLSGGGWQTITLSSLDERVSVSAPVAGYSAMRSRIERAEDVGDIEQNPADMLTIADYSHLTALRAPRPTLLIYNAEDDCCFRGPLVKPYIFNDVLPFFRLFNAEDRLAWHLNTDPSTHNYQLDNRLQAYRFFERHFGLPVRDREIPVAGQIKSPEELSVPLPENNLTVLGLARQLAGRITRTAAPPKSSSEREKWMLSERAKLSETVRYQPVEVARAWAVRSTWAKELESRAYRLALSNGLSANAVWFRALATPNGAPATIVVSDKGRKASADIVSDRLNRAEQVLAFDPVLTGNLDSAGWDAGGFTLMLSAMGDRALGIEAAQLIAAARWLSEAKNAPTVRLEASGIRAQVISAVAAALEPSLITEVVVHDGMTSLSHLFDKPVEFEKAPELFCFGLYKNFDLDQLAELAKPAESIR